MSKTTLWDVSEYLDSPEMIAAYINAAMEEGEPDMLRVALGDIAKAKGMATIASDAKISRQNLYKAFSQSSKPTLDTVQRVANSLGLDLILKPQEQTITSVRGG